MVIAGAMIFCPRIISFDELSFRNICISIDLYASWLVLNLSDFAVILTGITCLSLSLSEAAFLFGTYAGLATILFRTYAGLATIPALSVLVCPISQKYIHSGQIFCCSCSYYSEYFLTRMLGLPPVLFFLIPNIVYFVWVSLVLIKFPGLFLYQCHLLCCYTLCEVLKNCFYF